MSSRNLKKYLWLAVGLMLLATAAWALRPRPLIVETATVTRGAFVATVSAEARTHARELYVIAAPVDGELERNVLQPGDEVSESTTLARMRPAAPRPLDARSQAEAQAAVFAARAAVERADAAEREAAVALEHTESKLWRIRQLTEKGSAPAAELEHGGHEAEMSRRNLEGARAAARQARAELSRANAIADTSPGPSGTPSFTLKSPVAGQILRVLRESAGPVAAGTPLLEVGNIKQLEVIADLLSTDAASVRMGANASIKNWGGAELLRARVRRIDPAGFTQVSALGLEEQRVHVALDLIEPPPLGLGHDYRVDVSIVVWESESTLRAPSTALFRTGDHWTVFVIRSGRAHLTRVETGPSNAEWTVVKKGLAPGDTVIVQPSDEIREGTRVESMR